MVSKERNVDKGILDAIRNRPTDEDDPEEARLNQYDFNVTKVKVEKVGALGLEMDTGKILQYMTKIEWQAEETPALISANVMQPPPKLLVLPTKRIIVCHTGGKTCNSTVS